MEQENKEDLAKHEKKTNKVFTYTIFFLILVFITLFAVRFCSMKKDQGPVTLDDMVTKTVEGEMTEDNFLYNGFAFVKVDNLWYTQIQVGKKLFDLPLHFNPAESLEVPIQGQVNDIFKEAKKVYVTFDPTGEKLAFVALAVGELDLSLINIMQLEVIAACDRNETEACAERPIKTCEDSDDAVIYIKQQEPTQVTLNNNCIIIQGDERELTKATDRLLYHWLSVIPP